MPEPKPTTSSATRGAFSVEMLLANNLRWASVSVDAATALMQAGSTEAADMAHRAVMHLSTAVARSESIPFDNQWNKQGVPVGELPDESPFKEYLQDCAWVGEHTFTDGMPYMAMGLPSRPDEKRLAATLAEIRDLTASLMDHFEVSHDVGARTPAGNVEPPRALAKAPGT